MSFTWLNLKNLFRQRARTVLTVLGISLGIMTVVALGVITEKLSTMAGDLSHAGGADFFVGQKGSADFTFSFLAVGIGAIGVMNTMGMAVFERTREIGVFRAVGWSGHRILRMILTESLLLCAVATVVGIGLGLAASEAVVRMTSVGGLIEPAYTIPTFTQAIVVAVGVALVGAAYPSYRAVRLTPMEALRHE